MTEEKQYSWDAEDYAQNSSAQQGWAEELMKKLDLQGYEAVLDIGCGDGRITAELADLLPEGEVLGIDSSADMLDLAREKFSWSTHPNLSFQQRDARDLTSEAEFDVIFSSAALHWVSDHRPVLTVISRALKLGGRVLLQMAGKGNAASLIAILDELICSEKWRQYFTDFTFPYGFYGPELYTVWLKEAGLHPVRVELIRKDMSYPDRAGLEGWIRTTWLPYTERIPVERREAFVAELIDRYLEKYPVDKEGRIHVGTVRLEVEAGPGKCREMSLIDPPSPTDAP
ncbi:MAG: methyltransferase domain-containing protein [Candidatus Electrothrix sp. AUS1_2]|nr:methyltransferase domain-containing protein [Candidatus Electrothrix sp. AUS1_2]